MSDTKKRYTQGVFVSLKVSKKDLLWLRENQKEFDFPNDVDRGLTAAIIFFQQRFEGIKSGDLFGSNCKFCKRPIVWFSDKPHELILPSYSAPEVRNIGMVLHKCEQYHKSKHPIRDDQWDNLKDSLAEES